MRGEGELKSTTVIAVKRNGAVAMAGDGQVTFNSTILKSKARKVRRIFGGKVLAGFAGAVADALTLLDKFETHLEGSKGRIERAVVELAKEWRRDKFLRHLEAQLLVSDGRRLFLLSGGGEVIEPDEEVVAIGSGAGFALAAAKALLSHTSLSAREIAFESLKIASRICIYTNDEIVVEVIGGEVDDEK